MAGQQEGTSYACHAEVQQVVGPKALLQPLPLVGRQGRQMKKQIFTVQYERASRSWSERKLFSEYDLGSCFSLSWSRGMIRAHICWRTRLKRARR